MPPSEEKGSHIPRTAKARQAHLVHKRAHMHVDTCCRQRRQYAQRYRNKITMNMNPARFQREVQRSNIHESEPLAEVKRPVGGERRGSRLSIGRRKSSSTCRATSMVSSRSNSPSWSRTGSGLVEREGRQRELACLTAPSSWRTASSLLPTQTRVSWEQDPLWLDSYTPS